MKLRPIALVLAFGTLCLGCRDDSGSSTQLGGTPASRGTQGWTWGEDPFGWDDFVDIAIPAVGVAISVAAVSVAVNTARATRTAAEATQRDAEVAAAQATRATFLEESAQARNVGGFIDLTGGFRYMFDVGDLGRPKAGNKHVELSVVNASPLPVRNVIGHLVRERDNAHDVGQFKPRPVLVGKPNGVPEQLGVAEVPETEIDQLRLILEFDDDAGTRWRKYEEGRPLVRVADYPRIWPEP